MVPNNYVDLNWSLRPLNFWLRLTTGIGLLETNICNPILICYQFACLMANILIQILILRKITLDPASVTTSYDLLTTTEIWNTVIDYVNWAVSSLIAHLTLLVVISHRLMIIVGVFCRLTSIFDRFFYLKLRRLCIIGVACVVLLVSFNCTFIEAIIFILTFLL